MLGPWQMFLDFLIYRMFLEEHDVVVPFHKYHLARGERCDVSSDETERGLGVYAFVLNLYTPNIIASCGLFFWPIFLAIVQNID